MDNFLLETKDLRNLKKEHWRQLVQLMLVFACFCTIDTVAKKNASALIWLITAFVAVIAIAVVMFTSEKIVLGKWTNALNIVGALVIVLCHFFAFCYPIAIVFIVFVAGVRLIHVRRFLSDYIVLFFVIVSVFFGIVIRFPLVNLPVWSISILMLLSAFNPISEAEKVSEQANDNTPVKDTKINLMATVVVTTILVLYFIGIEIFGGPLTDAVSEYFVLEMNIIYLIGYSLFIASIFLFRVKTIGITVVVLSLIGLFFFLIPPFSTFGICFLLFIGGGFKVLMLAFPVVNYRGKWKYYGVFSGILVYRISLFLSGLVKEISGNLWNAYSMLSYTMAGINISLAVCLLFLLIQWERQEIRIATEKKITAQINKVCELPESLSVREKEVALLILDGLTAEEIAKKLFIADSTARVHIKSVLRKTECTTQKVFIVKYHSTSISEKK